MRIDATLTSTSHTTNPTKLRIGENTYPISPFQARSVPMSDFLEASEKIAGNLLRSRVEVRFQNVRREFSVSLQAGG